MDVARQKFIQLLKVHGLSITKPRVQVFDALYLYGLQTMTQLLTRTQANRASIYRSVESLEACGIIHRVPVGFKYKIELGEEFLPHHHHISCSKCGLHTDIEQSSLEKLLETIAQQQSYILTSHKVELSGLCPNCSQK